MIDYLRLAETLLAVAQLLTFSFWLKISAALMPMVRGVVYLV